MADEAPKTEPAAPKKSSPMKMTLMIVGAVTLVEAVGFFAAFKMFGGGPQVAHGEQPDTNHVEGPEPAEEKQTAEVELLSKFRVPNDKGGRLFIYDMDLFIKLDQEHKAELTELVAKRKGELSDRIARIIRGNEAEVLHEADLKSLRMQIRQTIGEMAGNDELVHEVLIPRFVPIRSD